MRTILGLALSALALTAHAQPLDRPRVGDLPNSNGRWQFGEVTIAAPARDVQAWLTDVARWPSRFPDIESAQPKGTSSDGRAIVRFRSRIIGRTLTIRMRTQPGLISYDGSGKDVTVQGRIYVEAIGATTTRVIMQSSADVHGLSGAFASENMKRERAFKKLRADLSALTHLARAYAAARRSGG